MQPITQKELVAKIFYSAVKAVHPYNTVKIHTDKIRFAYQQGKFKRLILIGFGKAAYAMAVAVEEEIGYIIDTGIVITRYGHNSVQQTDCTAEKNCCHNSFLHCCMVYEAGHPVPDENGLKGTDEIIKLLKYADERTLVVCLISGGGSALLVSPYDGITLVEKQKITDMLLKAGADIYELNTLRKHISKVKGGRLAEIAYPAKVISLILSDVIGDRIDVIASGPTSPDKTTFRDAINVLEKYGLIDKAPGSIIRVLQNGLKGLIDETPEEENRIFDNVENIIIGSNIKALNAAKTMAESFGLNAKIISSELRGEARDAGRWLAKKVKEFKYSRVQESKTPLCLISGGETVVTVKGNGKGGRNMELALAFATEIEGIDGITLLSAGSDGTDGLTDASGAIVDGETVKRARMVGLAPEDYLHNNDSYNFFKKTGDLFITGPTGTNIMDIQIMVIK